ncbi:MAG TPA: SdrD B-like domain-containing protein, partial [Longimicrobiales bacterium]|nr:SdrD B-like domain-containing protein [Longimicrobiales bacterium]
MRSSVRIGFTAMAVAGVLAACGDDDGTTDPPATGEVRVTVETAGAPESGVTIRLFEAGGTTATDTGTTGSNGQVTFTSLEPGGYDVEMDPPADRELADGEDSRKAVTVVAGQRAAVGFALAEVGGGDVVEVRLTGNLTFEPSTVT